MSPSSHRLWFAACALQLLWLFGCLEPEAELGIYSSYVMPADYRVPHYEEDQAAAKKLDLNDGLGTSITLRSGYAEGAEVQYWDLGTLTATTLRPMYIFRMANDPNGVMQQDQVIHPDLIDSIPGDTAYSPLRQIYVVFVTDRYRGERITSLRALEDAAELGLVSSPQPHPFFANCAVTLSTVQIQITDDGSSTVGSDAYYRGHIVKQFCAGGLVADVGAIKLKDNAFTAGNAYVLRRQSELSPLDESALKQDLNDDGDQIDTNTVFDSEVRADPGVYTGIWKSYDVSVSRTFQLGDVKAESELFDRKGSALAATAKVLDYKDTGVFLNRPQRLVPR
jgi:hypothetical protein